MDTVTTPDSPLTAVHSGRERDLLARIPGHQVQRVRTAASAIGRYGLVIVIGWIGAMKFFSFEANGIQPLVANSPLLGWTYHFLSVQQFSTSLGVVELLIAALLASRFLSPRLSAVGAVLAVGMFATTLSFLFTTPGIWEASKGGFPFIGLVSSFLLKDLLLLAVSLYCLADSLGAITRAPQE